MHTADVPGFHLILYTYFALEPAAEGQAWNQDACGRFMEQLLFSSRFPSHGEKLFK